KYFDVPHSSNSEVYLRILLVGNLRAQKNHQVLLEALSLMAPLKTKTTIIGDGPMMKEIKRLIKSLELKNIELLGSQDNIVPHLARSELFIMPSLFEGFGISLIEAMAAGLPCIVSDIPPFREIGDDSLIYFSPLDP